MSYRDRFWELDAIVGLFVAGVISRPEMERRHADLLAEMRAEVQAASAPGEREPCTFDDTAPF